MKYAKIILQFLTTYGTFFSVRGELDRFPCIITNKSSRNNGFLAPTIERLGNGISGDFVLLTTPDATSIKKGVELTIDRKFFVVRATDDLLIGEEPIYKIAILAAVGKEEVMPL